MIKVLQINLHHSSSASAELLKTCADEEFDIVLIQEPWLSGKGEIMGLASSKYTLFTALGEGRLRSAILSKKMAEF